MMRYSQAERMEIIHIVEHSELSIRKTLQELEVPRSTFYDWYRRYQEDGYGGLADKRTGPRQFWNQIPESVQNEIVDLALKHPEESSRQLAWKFTDEQEYFISESSVYRILKNFDLVQSPAFMMVGAKDKFENPTTSVNELWQTDFTYFKIIDWGWYYLSTVIDDYSRYILAWKLSPTMASDDVEETLNMALKKSGLDEVRVRHRPRLLSDNGPAYLSKDLKEYLKSKHIAHIRGAPYHPMTQGKIERWHRSMKNVVKLQNYYSPSELEKSIGEFVEYYNNERYHESIDNVTPADVYSGKSEEVLTKREQIKQNTLANRRKLNLPMSADTSTVSI
jgi:transposase InsO family protein/transposase-like protein